MGTLSPDILARLNAAIQAVQGRDPRYRYFQCQDCRAMFLWTTERMGDGKFASARMQPTGPGSQSGKPRAWATRAEVHHRTRKAAKARALSMYRRHVEQAATAIHGGRGAR